MISKAKDKIIISLVSELDKSYAMIRNYINDDSYPADICLKIQQLTKCEITAYELRPDLFEPTIAQVQLAENFMIDHQKLLEGGNVTHVISMLNYFENQCPTLYKNIIARMCKTKLGKELIAQRLIHKQNVSS